jgi:hypothetical protein
MKRIKIEYIFSEQERDRMRKYYREADIRTSLREAGLEELGCLVDDMEAWANREESSNGEKA